MRAAVALVGLALICVSPAPAAMGAAGGSEPAVAAFGGLLQLQLGSSVEDRLFTPELIFSYRTEIGLEWEQQAKIVELITEVQPELVPLQLELLGQTTALLRSIDQEDRARRGGVAGREDLQPRAASQGRASETVAPHQEPAAPRAAGEAPGPARRGAQVERRYGRARGI